MKKLAIPLAVLLMYAGAVGQSNWQRVTTAIGPSAIVNSITASGQLALGAVTDDLSPFQTVRSTDGGQSWNDELTQPALKLKALNSAFIYGVRGSAIMTSTTQGISWTSTSPAFNGAPVDVHYVNTTQAFAAGNSTVADSIFVAVTTNNWTGFTSSFLPVDSALAISIQFVNSQTGFVLARSIKAADNNAAIIFSTTNGGGTWAKQGALPDTCGGTLILAADFVDASTGWAVQTCGTSATIYKTTDAGANWAADTTLAGTFRAFAIDAVNQQNAWVVGQAGTTGTILRTTNGGNDWAAEAVPTNPSTGKLLSLSMLDATRGFASGEGATLLRYVPGPTGVDDGPSNRPKTFDLHQNYPNPFNAGTKISFSLLKRGKVKLTVYNILGEAVALLHEGELPAGRHEFNWNGTDRRGRTLSTGLYLYELRTSEERQARKMILLK